MRLALLGVDELDKFELSGTSPYRVAVIVNPPGTGERESTLNQATYDKFYPNSQGATELEKHQNLIKFLAAADRVNPPTTERKVGYTLYEDNRRVYQEYLDQSRNKSAVTVTRAPASAPTALAPGYNQASRSPTPATSSGPDSWVDAENRIAQNRRNEILTYALVIGGIGAVVGLGYWYWRN